MAADPIDNPTPEDKADRLKSLRKKLSKLNRAPLAEHAPDPAAQPEPPSHAPRIVYARDLPRVEPRRVRDGGICIPLEKCLEGCEAESERGPAFYLLEQPVAEAEPDSAGVLETVAQALEALARGAEEPLALAPEAVCFLDIETTGLGTSPVFLIGTLVWEAGELVCRQLLARTYAEEVSIVDRFVQDARRLSCVVTFNGKTFDVPFLRTRAAATGVPFRAPRFHFDLLHEARRVFKDRLPDCKLKTLERYVCQRYRGDDIAGSDIARAYHDFVRTGDARELALIVKHNRWDLVTMAHLMGKILVTRDA